MRLSFSILSCLLLLLTASASAEDIYRWETPDGTTVYSDKPQPNATKIEQRLAPTIHLPSNQPAAAAEVQKKLKASVNYQSLDITSPQDGFVFPVPPSSVFVNVKLTPDLQAGHRIVFLKDGKAAGEPTTNTSLSVNELYRGPHLLQAQVVDVTGKVLMSSKTITIFVRQPSVLQNKNKTTP